MSERERIAEALRDVAHKIRSYDPNLDKRDARVCVDAAVLLSSPEEVGEPVAHDPWDSDARCDELDPIHGRYCQLAIGHAGDHVWFGPRPDTTWRTRPTPPEAP